MLRMELTKVFLPIRIVIDNEDYMDYNLCTVVRQLFI